jgi:hypothetical protein
MQLHVEIVDSIIFITHFLFINNPNQNALKASTQLDEARAESV